MALVDEVKTRYSNDKLIQLTRPDDTGSTTINDPVLSEAADDATAEFEQHAQAAFDIDNTAHVALAVRGTVLKLKEYRGGASRELNEERTQWVRELQQVAKSQGRAWSTPISTSNLQPTRETTTRVVRPDFDQRHFAHLVPNPPGGLGRHSGAT